MDDGTATDEMMAERERWVEIIGRQVWGFMHHYCRGLNRVNRYYASKQEAYEPTEGDLRWQQYNLAMGLQEFRFVDGYLRRGPHFLYPEMLVNQGILYREQGEIGKALERLVEALRVKPDFAPGYVELARTLRAAGDPAEAAKILELGVQMTNGSPAVVAEARIPGQTRGAVGTSR